MFEKDAQPLSRDKRSGVEAELREEIGDEMTFAFLSLPLPPLRLSPSLFFVPSPHCLPLSR